MDAAKRFYDIGPVRINLDSLIQSVRAHAIEWKNTLGRILIDETKMNIKHSSDHMNVSILSNATLKIYWVADMSHSRQIGVKNVFTSKYNGIRRLQIGYAGHRNDSVIDNINGITDPANARNVQHFQRSSNWSGFSSSGSNAINFWYFCLSQFAYSDMFMSYVLEKKWHQLFNSSLLKIEELQPMKHRFAESTAHEINDFKSKVHYSAPIIL